MITDQELLAVHRGWLGQLTEEHVGLFVTPLALVRAQATIDRSVLADMQARFSAHVPALAGIWGAGSASPDGRTGRAGRLARAQLDPADMAIADLPALLTGVFEWPIGRLAGTPGGPPLPDLVARLEGFGDDRLEPTAALLEADKPVVLLREEPRGTPLDRPQPRPGAHWIASPEERFERLLRAREVPFGVLSNGHVIRLVYVPGIESAGHLSFPVHLLVETAGRDVLGGLILLLRDTLLSGPAARRLPAILRESRRAQNEVSTALAEQVLSALSDLLAGFETARHLSDGRLFEEADTATADRRQHLYGGLLAVAMRLVFLLYAEDQGLLPDDPTFTEAYGLTALYERLRADDARFHDTMDQRFGAWAQLVSLFSMVYFGAKHRGLHLPERLGDLFDPNAYPFLEGRPYRDERGKHGPLPELPRVPDGTVFRVLHKLLYLGPERISYGTLDVEQIGSVYEAMMGFSLEQAAGPSLLLRPEHVAVNLEDLLRKKPEDRLKALGEVGCKPTGAAAAEVKAALSTAALAAALEKHISPRMKGVIPQEGLFLQPTEERRHSGSHYTPRELTRPIVEKTLAPVLERLKEAGGPTHAQILELKVCDPAMGSGAFLVEACRQLAAALVEAWQRRPADRPKMGPSDIELVVAMRLVAQQCLYGVDKNPFAVALAKLSLWLVTLAKDHPFTFVDHALRGGDSLVGLTRRHIEGFHWAAAGQQAFLRVSIDKAIREAEDKRRQIQALAGSDDTGEKRRLLRDAEDATESVRRAGDFVVNVFFDEKTDKKRKERLEEYTVGMKIDLAKIPETSSPGLRPFHWEVEFPEVFGRDNPGFDAIVGNPPFAGKNTIIASGGEQYIEWLKAIHEGAHGNADLVAHFFRRAFDKLRKGGAFGLIATNTISQGDTRGTGLKWICKNGGVIYDATRRYKWPNAGAAVIVSIVHVHKEPYERRELVLDGQAVQHISAFLFHEGGSGDPAALKANAGKSFQGSIVLGMGFTFDDTAPSATSIEEMHRLIERDARNRELIFPYLGGEELNTHPEQKPHRYVINFARREEREARQWPDLMTIVEAKVKGTRGKHSTAEWWHFERPREELYGAILGKSCAIAVARTTKHLGFVLVPSTFVFSENLIVFALNVSAFGVLQSRTHDTWVRFTSSTLEDRQGYRPTDCFETFPFPPPGDPSTLHESHPALETIGAEYHQFRASLMVQNQQGLTATYNRFHDPEEQDPQIQKLRELHGAMDRAVLDAYGWTDIRPVCGFYLDHEDDEDDDTPGKPRKKKPWRYRWPDETRDLVLGRLLALNQQRAREEAAHQPPPAKKKAKR